jgi:hypothetical protein
MYQRKFIPDWWTCIFIQPLGLLEDVAVVLATWAGESESSQRAAEIWLYFFMILMNVVRLYYGRVKTQKAAAEVRDELPRNTALLKKLKKLEFHINTEHVVVVLLTVVAIAYRWNNSNPLLDSLNLFAESTTTTTTTASSIGCATESANTKVMLFTAAWVSFLAVAFRLVARVITCACAKGRSVEGPRGLVIEVLQEGAKEGLPGSLWDRGRAAEAREPLLGKPSPGDDIS